MDVKSIRFQKTVSSTKHCFELIETCGVIGQIDNSEYLKIV